MPAPGRRPSICLFCAFTSRASPTLPRSTRIPAAGFSNSVPTQRAPSKITRSRRRGDTFTDFPSSRGIESPRWREPSRGRETSRGRESFRGREPLLSRGLTIHRPGKTSTLTRNRSAITPQALSKIVLERLEGIERKQSNLIDSLKLTGPEKLKRWEKFKGQVKREALEKGLPRFAPKSSYHQAYLSTGEEGIDEQLKYAFYSSLAYEQFSGVDIATQKAQADMRHPTEWYPATRELQRKIICHVGPTNSGKTYNALKRLEEADTGVYAGPLRLLAHEVYTRMNAKGKPCRLSTGEERRIPSCVASDKGMLNACTVEMVPVNTLLDVAVIDEIQMIGSHDRGWAWTQALLGVKAKEVHLCGEARTVPLIKELAAQMGDVVEVHHYERLSPLKAADNSLRGNLRLLRPGDCVVAFSVVGIHALRKEIEAITGRKVAIVYGSLPPETRAQQAALFNDSNNDYDILVASDAIGMGLNLAIKRVIFETTMKFNGVEKVLLPIADIKQIGGRAGRYRTAAQANTEAQASLKSVDDGLPPATDVEPAPPVPKETETLGIVTTLEPYDLGTVQRAMSTEAPILRSAGIYPPDIMLERFARYFPPGTPFGYILLRLHEFASVDKRFHLCGLKDQLRIADELEGIENLSVPEKIIFCSSPAPVKTPEGRAFLRALGICVAEQRGGALTEISELPLETLDLPITPDRKTLYQLETLHHGLVLYLWLSYRFSGVFRTRALAFHAKEMTEKMITDTLSMFAATEENRKKQVEKRKFQKEMAELLMKNKEGAQEAESEEVEDDGTGFRFEPKDPLLDERIDEVADDVESEGQEQVEEQDTEENIEEVASEDVSDQNLEDNNPFPTTNSAHPDGSTTTPLAEHASERQSAQNNS